MMKGKDKNIEKSERKKMINTRPELWKLLWEYDPNGLIVVDENLNIQTVNPAFCRLFKQDGENIIGKSLPDIFEDVDDFREVMQKGGKKERPRKAFPEYGIIVKMIIFHVPDEDLTACIFVDITEEEKQREKILKMKKEAIEKVNKVIDNQMAVVQKIAGLLGETTAETKAHLLNLLSLFTKEEEI